MLKRNTSASIMAPLLTLLFTGALSFTATAAMQAARGVKSHAKNKGRKTRETISESVISVTVESEPLSTSTSYISYLPYAAAAAGCIAGAYCGYRLSCPGNTSIVTDLTPVTTLESIASTLRTNLWERIQLQAGPTILGTVIGAVGGHVLNWCTTAGAKQFPEAFGLTVAMGCGWQIAKLAIALGLKGAVQTPALEVSLQ